MINLVMWANFVSTFYNSCPCDELVDGDSMKLLFKIISSTCEQHNVAWRQTATDALLTITKNFTPKMFTQTNVYKNVCYV